MKKFWSTQWRWFQPTDPYEPYGYGKELRLAGTVDLHRWGVGIEVATRYGFTLRIQVACLVACLSYEFADFYDVPF